VRNSISEEIPSLKLVASANNHEREFPEREERHFQARAAGTSFVKPPICRWQAERRRLSMTRGVILRRLCKPLLDSTTGNSQKARVNISKEEAGLLAESDLIARPAI